MVTLTITTRDFIAIDRPYPIGCPGHILGIRKMLKSQFLVFVKLETFDILNDLTMFRILLAAFAIESDRE